MIDRQRPYKRLGLQLARLRKMVFESLNEVAGTLELDPDTLAQIERGVVKPSEEVLFLLVSHFGVKEDEASKLWEIAGYSPNKSNVATDQNDAMPMVMVMNDPRIIYSDSMHISVNNYGVVMNFMQNAPVQGSPLVVARVGMSREHAHSILDLLQNSLNFKPVAHLPKSLPSPRTQKDDSQK